MKQTKTAFTLIELIVVVVIIAILGTIAYMSLLDYSKTSRNSVRITDIGQIKQSLGIFEVETGKYPLPANYTEVTYSGGLLWFQGRYDQQVFKILDNLSKKSIDPLFEIEYDYSVINNKTKFQIGTMLEGTYLSLGSQSLFQVNAISENDSSSYVSGDYDLFDISSKVGSNCTLITSPSLFVNNLSSTGAMFTGGDYGFVHDGSKNYTQSYVPKIDNLTTPDLFSIEEVWTSCSMNTLDELNLYISRLAIAFQQLNGNDDFNEIIYNFNKNPFKQGMLEKLANNGIEVNPDLIRELQHPTEGNIFNDFFLDSNNTNLVSHISDTFGSWTSTGTLVPSSYQIIGNELTKTDANLGVMFINPTLPITSRDKTFMFTVEDFGGGDIFAYVKYDDINNNVGVKISSTGYEFFINELGSKIFSDSALETINTNTAIEFSVAGTSIDLKLNNTIKGPWIDAVNDLSGNPAISIDNGGIIDDFVLIYR